MSTIALRVPTRLPDRVLLATGQCYILFEAGPISVRALIAEKVRAELRKARAGGIAITSLPLLLATDLPIGLSPRDEQRAILRAEELFSECHYLLLHNGLPLVDLDEQVVLTRQSSVQFLVVPSAVPLEREVGA